MRVLLIAPYYDRNVPGESWSTYKWVEGVASHCEATVLTTHHSDWNPASSPIPTARIVNWTDPRLPRRLARINYELKPGYLLFYLRARRWIKAQLRSGWNFDLIHQINPLALRYPSPAAGLGLTYVIGPVAGSLDTPPGFKNERADRQWFRKLRSLDKVRLRHDQLLKRTYSDAALVLGVAPYVRELLAPIRIRRFEIMSETGVEGVVGKPKRAPSAGEPLRLLFVGRMIRTKGILDAVRAVAFAANHYTLRFDVIGDGDLLATCKEEALRLGVADLVHFHGRIPRDDIGAWYEKAHVFLFPSFREPSGNVVFEAMSYGCPVITSNRGGPGFVVDDSCGIRVEPRSPDYYVSELGTAITQIASKHSLIADLSAKALMRVNELADWGRKLQRLLHFYLEIVPTPGLNRSELGIDTSR